MPDDRILDLRIEDEIKESYLRYAMSVIVARALPDVRDGLKPSQRRILFAMNDLGLSPRTRFVKCAAIVGETMKKYHPHGEGAIYPTLARLAQPWNIRYGLIEGQGNFGSVDGDPPAAMRYTEARMTDHAIELLQDIGEDTVDFRPNYDESTKEPTVLPSRFPNLICNGSSGIAVGMATSIPPHNLGEVADAIAHLVDHPDCQTRDLLRFIQGPDFPTGGIICGRSALVRAYEEGRGRITVRAKLAIEVGENGRTEIAITEIPYQVSKSALLERLGELVREGRIDGVSDIKDYSDKRGMRMVVELKRGEDPQRVINSLYKHTELQTTFSIIMIALVRGRPETLSLKQMLEAWRDHRVEVIRRRSKFRLERAKARHHIVLGYIAALDHIDEIIALIRASAHAEEAEARLVAEYSLSEKQAEAILQMQLRRLTALERKALLEEKSKLEVEMKDLDDILAREARVFGIIKADLADLKKKYADGRRTAFAGEVGEIVEEDLIPLTSVIVTVTREGYIKATPVDSYRAQRRGGVGISGAQTKEGDLIEQIFVADTHDTLLFFTDLGKVYGLKVYDVPQAGRTAKGRAFVNLIDLGPGETVTNMMAVKAFDERFIMFATRDGTVKKTSLKEYEYVPRNGKIGIILDEGDRLVQAKLTSGEDTVLLGSAQGYAIRFAEGEARPMGRAARGTRGIKLREGDRVTDLALVSEGKDVLTVCESGYGKRTPWDEYPVQHRGGLGVRNIKTEGRNGPVVGMKAVTDGDEIVLITQGGMVVRTRVDANLRPIGRNTMGLRLIRLQEGDTLVGMARVPPMDVEEGGGAAPPSLGAGAAPEEPLAAEPEPEDVAEGPEDEDDAEE